MKRSHLLKYKNVVNLIALFSKNERLKVGCLIIKNGRIVSTGYNGGLPGEPEKPIIINEHDISTSHAESNALANCCLNGISTKDCIAIVSHFPCQLCTKQLIMSGIKEIYYVNDYKNEENPFRKNIKITKI